MTTYKSDQICTRCGEIVTAKELNKGARQFYEYILLRMQHRTMESWLLCVACEVNLTKFFKMEQPLPQTKRPEAK